MRVTSSLKSECASDTGVKSYKGENSVEKIGHYTVYLYGVLHTLRCPGIRKPVVHAVDVPVEEHTKSEMNGRISRLLELNYERNG